MYMLCTSGKYNISRVRAASDWNTRLWSRICSDRIESACVLGRDKTLQSIKKKVYFYKNQWETIDDVTLYLLTIWWLPGFTPSLLLHIVAMSSNGFLMTLISLIGIPSASSSFRKSWSPFSWCKRAVVTNALLCPITWGKHTWNLIL